MKSPPVGRIADAFHLMRRQIPRWLQTPANGLILIYHRVTTLDSDPQQLAVTPENFADQLQALRGWGDPLRLTDLADPTSWRQRERPFYAITFDDGYADNFHQALPVLERFETPATVFVASGYVDKTVEFWWDELERLLLCTERLDGPVPEFVKTLELAKLGLVDFPEHQRNRYRDWSVLKNSSPTPRHRMYRRLCRHLHVQNVETRETQLAALRDWARVAEEGRPTHRAMTRQELRTLAASELVDIGAHTVHHPSLSSLPEAMQRQEIADSRRQLSAFINRPITTFSYPFGSAEDYDRDTVRIVDELGFQVVCANRQAAVRDDASPLELPRRLVRDWPATTLQSRLRKWISR